MSLIEALFSPHINGSSIALIAVAVLTMYWGIRRDERKNARRDTE
ncbi:hypothetical protein [Arthrobacter rhombi]